MDLLKKMLEKDPIKRITATDALSHEFIRPINIESSGFKDSCTLLSFNNIA
jgi:serine/threonine protein kinase